MADRRTAIDGFLCRAGWRAAARVPITGDASFRRYERLQGDGGSAVLMDAPPPDQDVRSFLRVGQRLADWGYSVPAVLSADRADGLLLLEDFGERRFAEDLDAGMDPETLYGAAVDVLADLHGHVPPPALPDYSLDMMLEEVERVLDWYMPARTGGAVTAAACADYRQAWTTVLRPLIGRAKTVTLLDYHVENLIWLPERTGHRRVGLLDFQDARIGPPEYDLASLLGDVRRDVDPALAQSMLRRYMDRRMGPVDGGDCEMVFRLTGAQRNARLVGQWVRLWKRDDKPRYLALMPRTWRMLEMDLSHPHLSPVARWFDEHIPPEDRMAALPGAPA